MTIASVTLSPCHLVTLSSFGWPKVGMGIFSVWTCMLGRTCCSAPTATHSSFFSPSMMTRKPSGWSAVVTRRY